jgi:hypothetical protein
MPAQTSVYNLNKPTVLGDADTWGGSAGLNGTIDKIEAAMKATATTGTATAYVLSSGLSLTAYATGQVLRIIPNNTNTGAATINVDGLGAKSLTKQGAAALDAGDLVSGRVYELAYDGTQFQVVGLVAAPLIHNRFVNSDNQIDQRNAGAAQTITAGAALAYTIDRWYAYCTGANVTGQQIAGSGADLFRYRFTGAASVTKIGFATRIEARDSADMAGGAATIAVELANSLLTTVTWTAWYADTADTFGSLASPTRTSIATGAFTVTSTLTTYTATIAVPSAATTGIEVEFSVAAQTSGTWTIGKRAIIKGSAWTGFAPPSDPEIERCERYLEKSYNLSQAPGSSGTTDSALCFVANGTGGFGNGAHQFRTRKRGNPTIVIYNPVGGATASIRDITTDTDDTSSISALSPTEGGFQGIGGTRIDGNTYQFHYLASSEL